VSTLSKMYDGEFYDIIRHGSEESSRSVVPVVMDLIRPERVVDVGCGDGTWLKTFMDHGVREVLGIDGDYVRPEDLQIPQNRFRSYDLSDPKIFEPSPGCFDLVVSLEVAEHLPPHAAEPFVSFLCSLGPVVLFSAAVPGQGGTNHLNERWQDYWANLFTKNNYVALDCIQRQIWDNRAIQYWYRQNMMLFVSKAYKPCNTQLSSALANPPMRVVPRVHPDFLLSVVWRAENPELRVLCRALPGAISRVMKRHVLRNNGARGR
jgi:SAM-dependent methyltransferase